MKQLTSNQTILENLEKRGDLTCGQTDCVQKPERYGSANSFPARGDS